VLYLDNLESLQSGPAGEDIGAFADWRNPECAAFWQGLRRLQRQSPGQLAILASTRNRQPDFGAGVPFRRLSDDAMWRMMPWFPSLRRLSEASRAGLVDRLAGHPRSVEYLDALIDQALLKWEYDNGDFQTGCLSAAEEQAQIIARVLPELDVQLSENLLFDALWDRVLDEPARALLIRAGVLRQPATMVLLITLADSEGRDAIERLRRTALLSEIRDTQPDGRMILSLFEVHPTVMRLIEGHSEPGFLTGQRREGHQLAALHYEQAITTATWQEDIEAAYHLRQIGEAGRAYDRLVPLIDGMLGRGHIREMHRLLAEVGDPAALPKRQ
jgi:hypothetical protein